MNNNTARKNGFKTSEFLHTLVLQGLALVTLLGEFDTGDARFNAILKAAALLAGAFGVKGYADSRAKVKEAVEFSDRIGMVETGYPAPSNNNPRLSDGVQDLSQDPNISYTATGDIE